MAPDAVGFCANAQTMIGKSGSLTSEPKNPRLRQVLRFGRKQARLPHDAVLMRSTRQPASCNGLESPCSVHRVQSIGDWCTRSKNGVAITKYPSGLSIVNTFFAARDGHLRCSNT